MSSAVGIPSASIHLNGPQCLMPHAPCTHPPSCTRHNAGSAATTPGGSGGAAGTTSGSCPTMKGPATRQLSSGLPSSCRIGAGAYGRVQAPSSLYAGGVAETVLHLLHATQCSVHAGRNCFALCVPIAGLRSRGVSCPLGPKLIAMCSQERPGPSLRHGVLVGQV